MKKWLLPIMALFLAAGMMVPAGAKAEMAFFTKSAVTHADGTTAQPYALNEKMTLLLDWTYAGEEPAVYTVPDIFTVTSAEIELQTAEGKKAGTVKTDAAANTVTILVEQAQSGNKGTIAVPVTFNKEKVTKAGTYSAVFPTGETASLTVTEAAAGAIKLVALEKDTKTKLAGSTFTVVNDLGKVVGLLTTNSAGEATVPNLEFGTYTITQTTAPDGYAVPADPWKVDLNAVLVTKEIVLEKATGLTGGLTVSAVEKGTDTPIEGAEFELKTANGLFSKKIVTDSKGKASLTGLAYGTYTLTQLKTTEKYVLPSESWTITVGRQTPIEQKIENTLENPYGALTVELTDASSDKALQGAEYSLFDEEDKLVSKVVTNDKGIASFPNLAAGSYELEETDAPDGYTRSTGKKAVTIKSGETVELELEKTKATSTSSVDSDGSGTTKSASGTLPQTGDASNMMYMLGGVLLAAGGLLLVRKGKRA